VRLIVKVNIELLIKHVFATEKLAIAIYQVHTLLPNWLIVSRPITTAQSKRCSPSWE